MTVPVEDHLTVDQCLNAFASVLVYEILTGEAEALREEGGLKLDMTKKYVLVGGDTGRR